jgi:predicted nucleic acid-binding protein
VGRRALSRDPELAAVHSLDIEVASALRRLEREGAIGAARAQRAIDDLSLLPAERYPITPLLPRVWTLRHNMSADDAAHGALAEALGATLLTTDATFARAPGLRVDVISYGG